MFLERDLKSQEVCRSPIDLKEIQEPTDNGPLVNTSTQPEFEKHVVHNAISIPFRKSTRVSNPLEFYGFHIMTDGDMLTGTTH